MNTNFQFCPVLWENQIRPLINNHDINLQNEIGYKTHIHDYLLQRNRMVADTLACKLRELFENNKEFLIDLASNQSSLDTPKMSKFKTIPVLTLRKDITP